MPMSNSFEGILTFTGVKVDPFNLDPDLINLTDISHALSYQNRFNGHTRRPLSVAEHSLNVHRYVDHRETERWECQQALMHDATEAYIPDLASPLKHKMPEFQALEAGVWDAICLRFNLPVEMSPIVEEGDRQVFYYEFHTAMNESHVQLNMPRPRPPFTGCRDRTSSTYTPDHWAHEFREQCRKLDIE